MLRDPIQMRSRYLQALQSSRLHLICSLVSDDDHGLSKVLARMDCREGLLCLLQTVVAILDNSDLSLGGERENGSVELIGGSFSLRAETEEESMDSDTVLEDLAPMLL